MCRNRNKNNVQETGKAEEYMNIYENKQQDNIMLFYCIDVLL